MLLGGIFCLSENKNIFKIIGDLQDVCDLRLSV